MRPHTLTLLPPLLALFTLTHTQSTDHFLTTMPTCWQLCFQSQFPNCPNQNTTDTATLCPFIHPSPLRTSTSTSPSVSRLLGTNGQSTGVCGTALAQPSMFSALITCVTDHCNNHTDPTAPLDAWATACSTIQHPLPSGEVQSAEKAVATATASSTTVSSTTPSSSATATSSHAAGGKGSGNGSLVDLTNMATRQRARSMLGLTVGIVAGVVWF